MDSLQFPISRRQLLACAVSCSAATQVAAVTSESINGWEQTRAQWVLNTRLAYFDTARFAPSTRALLVAEYRAQEALHSNPQAFFREQCSASNVQSLCNQLGRWLDCSANELCVTSDTADGLQRYARQLSLQPGDEVIIHGQLPQTLRDFWNQQVRDRGVVLKSVDLPLPLLDSAQVVAAFEHALNERSRVLMCSHIQAIDGAILPVRELSALARSRGVLTLIDGGLALGALQFSLRELACDVYGSSFAHWLNGPSIGLLYVRQDLQATLTATDRSDQSPDRQVWPQLAGLWPEALIAAAAVLPALQLTLDFHEKLGRARVEGRLLALQTYARLRLQPLSALELLTPTQAGMYLQVLSLRPGQRSAAQLADWLRNNDQVIVSGLSHINPALSNVLRISFNVYNSHDDIDRMLLGLQRALRA